MYGLSFTVSHHNDKGVRRVSVSVNETPVLSVSYWHFVNSCYSEGEIGLLRGIIFTHLKFYKYLLLLIILIKVFS